MVSLFIDSNQRSGNTLFVGYRTNNHEGGNDTLRFDLNDKSNSLVEKTEKEKHADYHELTYTVNGKDTLLIMSYYNVKTNFVGSGAYIKVPNNLHGTENDEIQIMVNRELFSGNYTLTDATGNKKHIQLTDDGRIIGLLQFKTYYVFTDFTMDAPGEGVDGVAFYTEGNYLRNGRNFVYQIKDGLINLYELKAANDSAYRSPKSLIYKLAKESK